MFAIRSPSETDGPLADAELEAEDTYRPLGTNEGGTQKAGLAKPEQNSLPGIGFVTFTSGSGQTVKHISIRSDLCFKHI